ncbi:MAG TPA: carboxypeptidase-like regulatory domain-containing protein [Pyrinomonadaceae bacterium]|nr:carboxypeptidase-like regulatory domain-containing protein [Pyrinomonadaceae bacterium]
MSEPKDLLARVRVATPCPASWNKMEGDERVRFCSQCELHVYNLSEMTKQEAESLVAKTEGRLCGRMYRRADGTILTKDCPVGVRALRRRVSRASGAAFAALLSFCSLAFGQTPTQKMSCERGGEITVQKKKTTTGTLSTLSGVVRDPLGAVVPVADVTVMDEKTGKKFGAKTSDEGEFTLAQLPEGAYTFEITYPGFMTLTIKGFKVGAGEALSVEASLAVGETMTGIVVIALPPKPDFESSGGKTVIRGRMLTDLPIPR